MGCSPMHQFLPFPNLHFIGRSPGNASTENHHIRNPQAAQFPAYVAHDFVSCQLHALAWHYKGRNLFGSILVKTDGGTIGNRMHSPQACVYIFEVNLLAATNDHVLFPAGDVDVTILIAVSEVAGFEPLILRTAKTVGRTLEIPLLHNTFPGHE